MSPKEKSQTVAKLINALLNKDFARCKKYLLLLCENVELQELMGVFCENLYSALALHLLLLETGLNKFPKGSAPRRLFLNTTLVLLKNKTQVFDMVLKKIPRSLQAEVISSHRNNDIISDRLNITVEDLWADAQEVADFWATKPQKDVTVH